MLIGASIAKPTWFCWRVRGLILELAVRAPRVHVVMALGSNLTLRSGRGGGTKRHALSAKPQTDWRFVSN